MSNTAMLVFHFSINQHHSITKEFRENSYGQDRDEFPVWT